MSILNIIADPEKYFASGPNGILAEDRKNRSVYVDESGAVRWSLLGAFLKVHGNKSSLMENPQYQKLMLAIRPTEERSLVAFGETHTHEEVIELIRNAGV